MKCEIRSWISLRAKSSASLLQKLLHCVANNDITQMKLKIPPCFVLNISRKKCCVPVPGSSSSIFIIVGAHFRSTPIIMLASSHRISPLKTLPWAFTKWWWCSRRKCLNISFIGRVSVQSNSGHCTGLNGQISSCSRRFWKQKKYERFPEREERENARIF